MQLPIDKGSERAMVRDALKMRARRLDKRAVVVAEYARLRARREMIEHIIRTNTSTF